MYNFKLLISQKKQNEKTTKKQVQKNQHLQIKLHYQSDFAIIHVEEACGVIEPSEV